MAGRPKSGITADTDVNLDFLTKEEREALLSKKMDMIRQRNKLINERHEMIEADRRKAEESGNAVKALDSKTLPAEGAPNKPRGRGRGQSQGAHRDSNKLMKDRPKSHGDASSYEPIVDVSDFSVTVQRTDNKNRGKGGQFHQDRDGGSTSTPKNRRKPQHKDEGPPPDPTFNPLVDRRRGGGGGGGGGDKKESYDHKRHPRNYGGGADLSKVKDSMKTLREKERERPSSAKPLEIVMTGRERKNHEQWKQERDRYDNERIQRQLLDGGNWKREWDHDKVILEYDDPPHRMEPAKRPAGRIGSGRFDRGDRDDRPRTTATRDGKGGTTQQHQSPQSAQPNHHHSQQPQSPPQHSPHSPPPTQHVESKTPKGKGRGRGRGRGRGVSQGGSVGDKSPRPRTWSGGDDRFVECQKEMLVVKFENTAGDNTVEVEYDNGTPMSPTPSSKSSGSTPGRGPTGRTPNQGGSAGGNSRPKGSKNQNHKHDKFSKGRGGSGRGAGQHQQHTEPRGYPDQFVDADWDNSLNHRHSYDGSKVRTSSHSQSHGDSEEWEDCTESSGAPDEDDSHDGNTNLHLECHLNPEAPEFLPTSPDFMKTPPGHVKVLNWAGSNSPYSPQSNLSQPSFSTSSPRQIDAASNKSSVSSPGSSASTRAKNRREEMDCMPEPDEPLPPPFLLQAEMSNVIGSVKNEEEVDEDDDRFEDSVEVNPEENEKEDVQDSQLNSKESLENQDCESNRDVSKEDSSQPAIEAEKDDGTEKDDEEEKVEMDEVEPQPVNGHILDDDESSSPDLESQKKHEEADKLQSDEGISETADVSESVTDKPGQNDEETSSDSVADSNDKLLKTNLQKDGTDTILDNDPDTDMKSEVDQSVSTETTESGKDSEPTAENSAAS